MEITFIFFQRFYTIWLIDLLNSTFHLYFYYFHDYFKQCDFLRKKPTKAIRVYIMYIKKVVPVFRIINSILGRRHFSFHTSYSLPLLAFVCKFCIDFSYSYYEVEFSLHYFFCFGVKIASWSENLSIYC